MANKVIDLHGISYAVKEKEIIKNVSFSVEDGDTFALIGENGSGKSTLIDIILKDIKPNSGTVSIKGEHNGKILDIGVVYDKLPLFPMLKVSEIINFFSGLQGKDPTVVEESGLIEIFGINPIMDSMIKNLSQGEGQRLSLLLAVLHNPSLLVLDEAFANLDPLVIERIWPYLKGGHRTVFYTAHNWKIVEKYATKVAFLWHGALLGEPRTPEGWLSSLPGKRKITISSANEVPEYGRKPSYEYDGQHIYFVESEKDINDLNINTHNYSYSNVELVDAYLYNIYAVK